MSFIDASKAGESLISDYNIYVDTGITKETETKDIARIITHINSQEDYLAVRMNDDFIGKLDKNTVQNKWKQLIEKPIFDYFRWPVDVITLDYNYYLVYDIIPTAHLKSVAEQSFDKNFLGIENNKIRTIVLNYIDAFLRMSEKGYLYFGFDDDNIYTDLDNGSILIPVYNSIYVDNSVKVSFRMKDYFSEVVDPYSYENRQISNEDTLEDVYTYDKRSESYAFVSILFRLLIGLYPYEGPTMAEYSNNQFSEDNREWIYNYVNNPVFIFDDNDQSNSVKNSNRFKPFVRRWDMLSNQLQTMFKMTFSEKSVFRENDNFKPYPIVQWKHEIENLFSGIDNEVKK